MKFSEKIKILRNNRKLTQKQLADKLNVTLRTIANYESGVSYPKKRETYKELADILNVHTDYLLTENEEFILNAKEQFGLRGAKEARLLVSELATLFEGGSLDEEDKDEMMKSYQDAYWLSKKNKK